MCICTGVANKLVNEAKGFTERGVGVGVGGRMMGKH